MAETKRPLIIDTDAGCDFAHAVMLIHGCGLFDIQGICTEAGNTTPRKAATQVSYLAGLCGAEWPVFTGAERPLIVRREGTAAPDGSEVLERFSGNAPAKSSAERPWDFIYRRARELNGEAELFCTGPLTNIAIAIIRHRDLPRYIKRITIAGGSSGAGNATVYAEYNVYSDPHAFKCVLDAGFRNLDLADLEFSRSLALDPAETVRFSDLPDSNPWKPFLEAAEKDRISRIASLSSAAKLRNRGLCSMDAAAAFLMAIPAAVTSTGIYAMVELRSELCSGRTLFDFRKRFTDEPNVRLARYTSEAMFTDFYFRCLRTFDRGVLQ